MRKLTLKRVARAKWKRGRHPDGGGLYLVVDSRTSAYWCFRFTSPLTRRERWCGLGSLADFTLSEARERARKARQLLADRIDPIAAKQAATAATLMTFEEAATRYYDDHAHKWSNAKHRDQFFSTLRTYAYPKLGQLNVANIDTAVILDLLKQPVAAKKNRPAGPLNIARAETADRLRMRIEWVLDWCTVHKHRSGENPARRQVIAAGLPRTSRVTHHHASMPYPAVPGFMARLRGQVGTAARALEFAILTACRSNEVIGATWPEIDLDAKVWIVPGERMKAREEHRVPLAAAAVELLKSLPREQGNSFVFIGPRSARLSNGAMAAVLDRMGVTSATPHGFRSSFRTWGEEQTAHPHIVLEMALAHRVDDKVVRTYRRTDLLDKRRRTMNDWADYLASSQPANLVEFKR